MRTANFKFSCDVYREGVYKFTFCIIVVQAKNIDVN